MHTESVLASCPSFGAYLLMDTKEKGTRTPVVASENCREWVLTLFTTNFKEQSK